MTSPRDKLRTDEFAGIRVKIAAVLRSPLNERLNLIECLTDSLKGIGTVLGLKSLYESQVFSPSILQLDASSDSEDREGIAWPKVQVIGKNRIGHSMMRARLGETETGVSCSECVRRFPAARAAQPAF